MQSFFYFSSYGSSRLYASGSHLSSLNCPTAFSSLKASLSRDLIEEPVILKGHSGPVHSVQFLYDPNTPLEAFGNPTHLISTGNDGTARLFDVSRRQNICAYVASSNSSCVWDVDTFGLEYFVTGGLDQTCRVFQSERLYPLRILAGHTDSVDCVKFHNTGKYIASAGSDGTARFWAVNEAKVARQFHGGSQATNFFCGTPMSLAFSSDGRKLAVAHGIAETVSVWDIGEQRLLQVGFISIHIHYLGHW